MPGHLLNCVARAAAVTSSASCRSMVRRLAPTSLVSRRHLGDIADGSGLCGKSNEKSNAHLEILDHALTKVGGLGWTRESVIEAASELGYSGMAHGVAEGGGIGLLSHFLDRALDETCIEVDDQLHEFDSTGDRLRFICRTRLRQTLPYVKRWPEAAALLAQPENVPLAMDHLGRLSSQMWYLAGDDSARVDWYLRRSALAAVYLSTELYMCEDRSPNHEYTWMFLKKRLEEMDAAEAVSENAAAFGEQFGRNLYNILASRGYVPH